jgi:signal transduction histidine kinase
MVQRSPSHDTLLAQTLESVIGVMPVPILVADYSALLDRYAGMPVEDIERSLASDRELLTCCDLVRHIAMSGAWIALYGEPARNELDRIPARLPDPSVYPTLRQSLRDQFLAPFRGVTSVVREHKVPTVGGGDVIVRSHWSPIKIDGEPHYATIVVADLDLTELRAVEDELSQSARLSAVGSLAAGIAHEINTPMQYIGDNTRFLEKAFERLLTLADAIESFGAGDLRQEAAELSELAANLKLAFLRERIPKALGQSFEGIAAVSRIVHAMREFSHPGEETREPVDVNRSIETTMTVCRSVWKYTAEVETVLDPGLPPVAGFPGELGQVFLNLIVNAVHAIEDAGRGDGCGRIRISTSRRGSTVVTRVTDNGAGIPPPVLERIYEPFFTTKAVGRGTGQGLAMVHHIVTNRHGGSIDVDTEVGAGTTFTLTLPVSGEKRSDR